MMYLETPKREVEGRKIQMPDGSTDWKVAFESWRCPELAAQLKPCPFCGGGFTFVQDVDYWNSGRVHRFQYYIHKNIYREVGKYCPLVMIANGSCTLPAGDARPDEGYGGEIVEIWNRRVNDG